MPDWTYHPVYRPVVFRLPAEDARRLTIAYLHVQGLTKVGRAVFRALSYGVPEPSDGLEVFGMRFRSPFGFGPGLDVEGRAMAVVQYLGCGFIVLGPVSSQGRPRTRSLDRQRLGDDHSLVWSTGGYTPDARSVRANIGRVRERTRLEVPVGVELDDVEPVAAIGVLESVADFFAVSAAASFDERSLAEIREATTKPVILRLGLDTDDAEIMTRAEIAARQGFNGLVVGSSAPFDGLAGGRLVGPAMLARTILLLSELAKRSGPSLPLIAAGGAVTPSAALACLDAGATLVEFSAGYVYAGPGIASRALTVKSARREYRVSSEEVVNSQPSSLPSSDAALTIATPPSRERSGMTLKLWSLLTAVAGVALAVGARHDLVGVSRSAPLVLTRGAADAPVAAGLLLISVAALTATSASYRRRGETWSLWYFVAGALAAGLQAPPLAVGGIIVAAALEAPSLWLRGLKAWSRRGPHAWRWSAANLGRRSLQLSAVAATVVAVPSLDSEHATVATVAGAVLYIGLVQRGLRPGFRALWVALAAAVACLIASVTTLFLQSWSVAGLALAISLGAMGLVWTYGPLVKLDDDGADFPDV